MRFLVDAQLPPALARWIKSKGFEAQHVMDVEMGAATDTAIWDYALHTQAILVGKDEDFAVVCAGARLRVCPRAWWDCSQY